MIFKPYGDSAMLIEFEQKICPTINAQIIRLEKAIKMAQIKGIRCTIPAYCSLTICFNPKIITYQALYHQVKKQITPKSPPPLSRKLQIPICYKAPFNLDLQEVIFQTKLSQEAIIEQHTQTIYQVYMLGFLPGFAYLGKLPKNLFCKRKEKPRRQVPSGSIGLAGYQTGIYPSDSPGGWQIIGRCPIPLFDSNQDELFLFQIGDQVRFEPISLAAFQQMENDWENKKITWETLIQT